jgi:hypothetical protein
MAYRGGQLPPGGCFHFQLFLTPESQLVELGTAIIFACSPVRLDPAAALESMQGRVYQRSLGKFDPFFGHELIYPYHFDTTRVHFCDVEVQGERFFSAWKSSRFVLFS